jgi:HD-GYP domain-containing protein (c-di-GMP phosphodiesterase class II)
MTTDRPYRQRLAQGEARRRLLAASGSQFDPRVVDAFVELLDAPAAGREDVVAVS